MPGPTRQELWFRLVFSIAGLVLLGAVVMVRGISNAAALVEVVGIAGLFFGGTAFWSVYRLIKPRD